MALPESDHYISKEMEHEFTDSRTIKWTLISSSRPLILIMLIYWFIIYFAGPRFMKNRQSYSLKQFIQCYNIFQVIANFWLVFNTVKNCRIIAAVFRFHYSYDNICDGDPEGELAIMWWTLILKIIDLIETVLFILRKKGNQVSLLHVYHHTSTVFIIWCCLRYLVHGFNTFAGALNGSVHVIMYSYYFLSTYGPKMQQKLLPFKKWLTIIQMVQLTLIALPCLQGFTSYSTRKERYFATLMFFNTVLNLSLFYNFYKNSYTKSSKTA